MTTQQQQQQQWHHFMAGPDLYWPSPLEVLEPTLDLDSEEFSLRQLLRSRCLDYLNDKSSDVWRKIFPPEIWDATTWAFREFELWWQSSYRELVFADRPLGDPGWRFGCSIDAVCRDQEENLVLVLITMDKQVTAQSVLRAGAQARLCRVLGKAIDKAIILSLPRGDWYRETVLDSDALADAEAQFGRLLSLWWEQQQNMEEGGR